MNADQLRELIRDVPDFPRAGIGFKDITPVLADAKALSAVVELMTDPFRGDGVVAVAGIEARGFVLATPIATSLKTGFIPLRKPGKLPYETQSEPYSLEYGADSLEVHVDAVSPGDRVLLVDDVIATGGTAGAAIKLLQALGAEVVGLTLFIELAFLNGSDLLDASVPIHSIVTYD